MPKIIIASGPIIIEDNKVLLNKHGDDNFWKFPGGKVENFDFKDWNNSLEEVAKREVKEEMGIDVEIIKSLKTMMIPKPNEEDSFVVLVHFLAKRIGEIRIGKDIKEWKWIEVDNLPEDCAPNVKEIIKNI
ncbi:MAG: NUDIX domain-containing protein [Patescibacteria group bacterium]|nr:NUDIX domain-containing protein [Patescibacteria group bacterium]